MPVIFLVRHGQASFGAANYDELSALGRKQSAALGPVLAERCGRIDHVHSGTMQRHVDTAAEAIGALTPAVDPPTPTADARWNEYDFLDILSSHPDPGSDGPPQAAFSGVQGVLDRSLLRWIESGESSTCAESFPAFTTRVYAALDELAAGLGKGETAVVFTSGGPIAAICVRLLGLDGAGFVGMNRVLVNAGLTKVLSGSRGTTLLSVNEHAHFDGPAAELLSYR